VALPARRLGTTGPEISVIGFGAWAIGGGDWPYGWGPSNDEESIAAILYALDAGLTWIDTAPVYGYGRSEEVVGAALRLVSPSARPLVFTKCGQRWDVADRFKNPITTLAPASIRAECEDSLRRLGIEVIDLLQFHWPDRAGAPVEESWGEAVRLRDEGKVRHIGVCNFGVDLLERCEAVAHVETLQVPFSLIRRDTASELLGWSIDHGTGVLAYSPMQAGLLTGRFTAERAAALPRDDHRRSNPEYQEPQLARNLALVERLRPVAERHGTSLGALAISWTLAWPGVTGAIVGARAPDQVRDWIGAPAVRLSADDLAEIARAVQESGAGTGPTMPDGTATTVPAES
jgi:aryl-alcohol dehydrogenase-like predicted oxidoreductase